MGRIVNKILACKANELFKLENDSVLIPGADIYWSEKTGTVCVKMPNEWIEYMVGRTDIIPTEPGMSEIATEELDNILGI